MDVKKLFSRVPSNQKQGVFFWAVVAVLILIAVALVSVEVTIRHAEPILRQRVIDALSTRLKSRVELSSFHVSLARGIEVYGQNLAVYPNNLDDSKPTFSVKRFSFRTVLSNLVRNPMKIGHVDVQGLRIDLPPKGQRKQLPQLNSGNNNSSHGNSGHSNVSIFVGEMRITDAVLVLGTDKPNKVPLTFNIHNLKLESVGADRPMSFTATLVNPKPVGNIQSSGVFGPWNTDDFSSTPVQGSYSFSHADLGTIKGIGGILSSTGNYQGALNHIVVEGKTDTPDFELDVSGQKVPLETEFHAIVDGSNGNTYLEPVKAKLLNSTFTAKGFVVHNQGTPGHDIHLTVDMGDANIQDFLHLAVHTDPPLMNGKLRMHAKLEIPPGSQDVSQRMKLQGNFIILNAHFSNPKVQSRVDELSLRGQGKPDLAKEESKDPHTANIGSRMSGDFRLANGALNVSKLVYDVPGANVKLQGVYSLDGNTFDFHGTARMKATLSQMVGGWKGLLLKPVDPFFKKNGAGTQVPIKITGTKSAPHFGLDF